MFVKLRPPSLLTCHCTAGAGVPLAEAVNAAELPAHTAWSAGFVLRTGAALTVCVRTSEVLPLKLPSPPYCAVIKCAPTASEAVEKLACPDPSNGSVSRTVGPSLKSTVPVDVPVPGGVTVTA